ncbi:hypothetical protein LHK_02099 [Laribacter hongkongensis HLHK9]|uniref:Uncharacterized protein n=1 Tax=Laribacter hongkongensis (strain HLHK9) TaxID=557598 RepID=C1D9I1_LARHH|nr:hypothetical protein LHK_02099 [Laribacter hongkongensis HLHK9]
MICHFPLVNVREWLFADLLPGRGMVLAMRFAVLLYVWAPDGADGQGGAA